MSEHESWFSMQNFAWRQKQATSSHRKSFRKRFATRSIVQRKSASTAGTLDPDGEKKMPLRNKIGGKWQIITLQEASDYVDHEVLTNRFHVTHFAGCEVLFNKDTFYPNVDVKSIYLHDTRRDLPDQGMGFKKVFFHVPHFVDHRLAARSSLQCCPYISATFTPQKKGISKKLILTLRAIMISQEVDLVEGDFNGTAWR